MSVHCPKSLIKRILAHLFRVQMSDDGIFGHYLRADCNRFDGGKRI